MQPFLFSTLCAALEGWLEGQSQCDHWPDVVVDPDMATRMAKAAALVLESAEKSQQYAVREGYLKTITGAA